MIFNIYSIFIAKKNVKREFKKNYNIKIKNKIAFIFNSFIKHSNII